MAAIIKSAVRVALGWRRSGKTSFPTGTPTFTLLPLSLSGALSTSPSNGTIVGGTVGSQITSAGAPSGFAITGLKYTWAGGSGTGSFTITETNLQASNSPNTSTINYSIGSGAGSPTHGAFTFNAPANSGLLVLLEDI